jgi:hypothetical protein
VYCSYEEHAATALFFERRAVDGVIIHWSRELARIVWRLAMWLLLCSMAVMVVLECGDCCCRVEAVHVLVCVPLILAAGCLAGEYFELER